MHSFDSSLPARQTSHCQLTRVTRPHPLLGVRHAEMPPHPPRAASLEALAAARRYRPALLPALALVLLSASSCSPASYLPSCIGDATAPLPSAPVHPFSAAVVTRRLRWTAHRTKPALCTMMTRVRPARRQPRWPATLLAGSRPTGRPSRRIACSPARRVRRACMRRACMRRRRVIRTMDTRTSRRQCSNSNNTITTRACRTRLRRRTSMAQ